MRKLFLMVLASFAMMLVPRFTVTSNRRQSRHRTQTFTNC